MSTTVAPHHFPQTQYIRREVLSTGQNDRSGRRGKCISILGLGSVDAQCFPRYAIW